MASTYLQKQDEEALRLKQQQAAKNAALGSADQQAASLADAAKTTSAGGFTPSAQLQQAQQYVQQMQQQKPAAYQSAYTPQMQAQFEAIMNRQPFKYDLGSDPMFQQASDLYVQQGRRAMQDAIGEAVGLTGGYGNSYAQGVGQAAYGNYLQQLGALAPQYQQQAYARWQQEGADMADRFNMLAAREESDYGRYQDALKNYWAEADRAQQAESNLYDREYGAHMDKLAYDQQQAEWQQQLKQYDQNYAQQQAEWAQKQAEWQQYLKEYDRDTAQQQAEWQQQLKEYDQGVASENREYAYNLAMMMLQGGQMPSADVLAAAGISDVDAAAIRAMYKPKSSGSGSGSSGNSGNKQQKTPDGPGLVPGPGGKPMTPGELMIKGSVEDGVMKLTDTEVEDGVVSLRDYTANRENLDPFYAAQAATTPNNLFALKNQMQTDKEAYQNYVEKTIENDYLSGKIDKTQVKKLITKYLID